MTREQYVEVQSSNAPIGSERIKDILLLGDPVELTEDATPVSPIIHSKMLEFLLNSTPFFCGDCNNRYFAKAMTNCPECGQIVRTEWPEDVKIARDAEESTNA